MQSARGSVTAIATSAETMIVVYEGKGPQDRQGIYAERLSSGGDIRTILMAALPSREQIEGCSASSLLRMPSGTA